MAPTTVLHGAVWPASARAWRRSAALGSALGEGANVAAVYSVCCLPHTPGIQRCSLEKIHTYFFPRRHYGGGNPVVASNADAGKDRIVLDDRYA